MGIRWGNGGHVICEEEESEDHRYALTDHACTQISLWPPSFLTGIAHQLACLLCTTLLAFAHPSIIPYHSAQAKSHSSQKDPHFQFRSTFVLLGERGIRKFVTCMSPPVIIVHPSSLKSTFKAKARVPADAHCCEGLGQEESPLKFKAKARDHQSSSGR